MKSDPPSSPSRTRILVCDDEKLIRTRVRAILQEVPFFEIVGEAADSASAVKLAAELRPDVVLMDVSMPGMDGIEATRQIVSHSPGVRVLAFSSDSSPSTVRQMLAAGARGFLLKSGHTGELIAGIIQISTGDSFFSPASIDPAHKPPPD